MAVMFKPQGSLNLSTDPSKVGDNDFVRSKNMRVDVALRVASRDGSGVFNAESIGPCDVVVQGGDRYELGPSYFKNETQISPDKIVTPSISPPSGTYDDGQEITLSCETSGASIFYTTDGSHPDSGSNLYSTPFSAGSPMTIRVVAIKTGCTTSDLASASYVLRCATPAFDPSGDDQAIDQEITITCATAGASVYYTTDGSTPDTGSTLYSAPFTVTATVKAFATYAGMLDSTIATATYAIYTEYSGTFYQTSYNDDGWAEGSNFEKNYNFVAMGYAASNRIYNWAKFHNITIPNGATVTNAFLRLTSYSNTAGSTLKVEIAPVQAVSPANPNTNAEVLAYYNGITTGFSRWDLIGDAWTSGVAYDTPTIASFVNTIVNMGGWTSGSSILVTLTGWECATNAQKAWRAYTYPGGEPELHVTWRVY